MKRYAPLIQALIITATVTFLSGCVAGQTGQSTHATFSSPSSQHANANYQKDRAAILAMAGNYRVTFDFIETVSFVEQYELKERKLSGAHEVVRVIEDRPNFISLQHMLVVGGEKKFVIKHWRQDWHYEPTSVLTFIGSNSWESQKVEPAKAIGKWSQIVYQVDDAPRYGALGKWEHTNGISSWTPPVAWRPLPRRDATTRDDYQAVNAVNRHTITPEGWVHEQNNSKLILTGAPQILAREIGINTYKNTDSFDASVADNYWASTAEFWKSIRNEWAQIETTHHFFGLTIQGEPEALYMPILELADAVKNGNLSTEAASIQARETIRQYLTTDATTIKNRIPGKVSTEGTY